jgi:peptide/histidine transporter 3/4
MGTSYMIAVLITAFADTFVGRYQTVIISSMVEIIVRILHLIGCDLLVFVHSSHV